MKLSEVVNIVPIFIESSAGGKNLYARDNHPVNIAMCSGILKAYDKSGHGIIEFKGINTYWMYNLDEMRDKDYNEILEKFK